MNLLKLLKFTQLIYFKTLVYSKVKPLKKISEYLWRLHYKVSHLLVIYTIVTTIIFIRKIYIRQYQGFVVVYTVIVNLFTVFQQDDVECEENFPSNKVDMKLGEMNMKGKGVCDNAD